MGKPKDSVSDCEFIVYEITTVVAEGPRTKVGGILFDCYPPTR